MCTLDNVNTLMHTHLTNTNWVSLTGDKSTVATSTHHTPSATQTCDPAKHVMQPVFMQRYAVPMQPATAASCLRDDGGLVAACELLQLG